MSTLTVDESQLEQIVGKVVQQHLKLTFQDVDEVRKSPAEIIVRLETKIESLADAVEELRVEIADARVESKKDIEKLKAESLPLGLNQKKEAGNSSSRPPIHATNSKPSLRNSTPKPKPNLKKYTRGWQSLKTGKTILMRASRKWKAS